MAFSSLNLPCEGGADSHGLALTMVCLSAFRKTFNFHPWRGLSQLPCGAPFLSAFVCVPVVSEPVTICLQFQREALIAARTSHFPLRAPRSTVSTVSLVFLSAQRKCLFKKMKSDHLQISTDSLCGRQHKKKTCRQQNVCVEQSLQDKLSQPSRF